MANSGRKIFYRTAGQSHEGKDRDERRPRGNDKQLLTCGQTVNLTSESMDINDSREK